MVGSSFHFDRDARQARHSIIVWMGVEIDPKSPFLAGPSRLI
jgi:hypothetical protein